MILDFERRRPASRVIAAQHTSIDQEDLATEATPYGSAFLNRVARNKMIRLEGLQDLVYLRAALCLAPSVVTAEPERTLGAHAQPIWELQELGKLSSELGD